MDSSGRPKVLDEEESPAINSTRHGSLSTLTNEKPTNSNGMTKVHDLAFIVTICMAQILALSGLGQGFGMS